jgi:hypothetical protein
MSSQLDSWISKPDEDNGPLMNIASYSLVGVSAAFLAVRLWIRQSQSKLWLDDAVLGLSWVGFEESQNTADGSQRAGITPRFRHPESTGHKPGLRQACTGW